MGQASRPVLIFRNGCRVQNSGMTFAVNIVAIERNRGKHDVSRSVAGALDHLRKGLRRKPLIGIHRNDLGAARSRKAGTQAGARHWVLNINQINMNVSIGSNFERMAHTSYHAAANDDNLQIVEVLVLDALESAHRITGRTLNNQDHRKSRMRTTSNQVFRPLDSQ